MDINSFIDEINSKIDIVDFISRFVELKKAGRNYVGLCPFHHEKTPSFTVSREKGIFYCFGCKVGGNIVEFVKKYESLSFKEAIDYLCTEAEIPKPSFYNKNGEDSEKSKLYEINNSIMQFFKDSLLKNSLALEYLSNRGISKDIIEKFSIGFAPANSNELLSFISEKKLGLGDCQKLGLISLSKDGNYYSYFRDRIIFPIFDVQNHVIGFGGRTVHNEEPKYINSPDNIIFHKGKILFGFNLAKVETLKSRYLIIVEGYIDVISLFNKDISNVIATLGTAFTIDHALLLKKYADTLYFCFDSDSAGKIATKRALELIIPLEINCKVIEIPPPYKDPDEFIRANGKDCFLRLIDSSKSSFEYLWQETKKGYNFNDPLQVNKAIMEILSKLISLKNDVLLESYFKFISTDTSISLNSLYKEFSKLNKARGRLSLNSNRSLLLTKEKENLIFKGLLSLNKDIIEIIFEKVKEEDFSNSDSKKLYKKMFEFFQKKGYLNYREVLNEMDDEKLKQLIMELMFIDDSFVSEDSIMQCLSRIETNRKLIYLQDSLRESIKSGNIELSKSLEGELSKIVKEKNY